MYVIKKNLSISAALFVVFIFAWHTQATEEENVFVCVCE